MFCFMSFVMQLEQISYQFPGTDEPVLRDISLAFAPGERVCLAGANGSGKTTLALLLAGILSPSSGRILVMNQVVPTVPRGLAAFGYQNPDDQMVASVVEKEVAFGLELRNQPMTQMESVISAALESLEISHLARREIATLSGGEKQKTAIAALTVTEPHLLILDEPDSFLDADGKLALEDALRELKKKYPNLSEIRITQDRDTMARYDRLVVLVNGQVIADKPPSEILSDNSVLRASGLVTTPTHHSETNANDSSRSRTSTESVVRVKDLTFAYPDSEPVISRLNIEWHGGEILGVVGATGSGKSTLGLLLCGLLAPTTGTISYVGSSKRKGGGPLVTMAVQQPERQFFLQTCAEEIAFGPKNLGQSITGYQAERFLSQVGLDPAKYARRDPLTLSVGEQRRLAFAVLLALDRPFLIFDEPTAGLDPAGITQFETIVRELARSGTGILVISHDLGLIERVADRNIVLGAN